MACHFCRKAFRAQYSQLFGLLDGRWCVHLYSSSHRFHFFFNNCQASRSCRGQAADSNRARQGPKGPRNLQRNCGVKLRDKTMKPHMFSAVKDSFNGLYQGYSLFYYLTTHPFSWKRAVRVIWEPVQSLDGPAPRSNGALSCNQDCIVFPGIKNCQADPTQLTWAFGSAEVTVQPWTSTKALYSALVDHLSISRARSTGRGWESCLV